MSGKRGEKLLPAKASLRYGQTFFMIKPDAVRERHVGEILERIERRGFRIRTLKIFRFNKQLVCEFYAEHTKKEWFHSLMSFMLSGDCVAVIVEGEEAVSRMRRLIGATDPTKAKRGTLRKLFGHSGASNAVHGSDSWESAEREIGLLFPDFDLES